MSSVRNLLMYNDIGMLAVIGRRKLDHANFNLKKGFPSGSVGRNPPSNTADTGLIPGPGRSHLLRSNLSVCTPTVQPVR